MSEYIPETLPRLDYEQINWVDAPSRETPLSAENLNKMDTGLAALYDDMGVLDEIVRGTGGLEDQIDEFEEQVNDKIDELEDYIDTEMPGYVTDWLTEHVDPVGSAVVVDNTLTVTGAAADAKKTGDEISDLKQDNNRLDNLSYGISDNSMPVIMFEHGSLSGTGADDSYRASSRARTKGIVSFNALSVLTVTSGDYVVDWFNSGGTYTGSTTGNNTIIPANQKFRILVTLDKSAAASRSDALKDIVAVLVFKNDNVLSKK